MIKKQLIQTIPESKKYIAGNVIFQWLALVSNIVLMTIITTFIAGLIDGGSGIGKYNFSSMAAMVISLIVCVIVRAVCNIGSSKMSYLSSKTLISLFLPLNCLIVNSPLLGENPKEK